MKKNGQILVTTLIVLLLVSLTVVVITASISRNNRQVFSNVQYERNYNYAEARTIEAAEVLSSPQFDLDTLPSTGIGQAKCQPRGLNEYICTFTELATTHKTVLKIFESNVVESYSLVNEEYFDVKLESPGGGSYTGNVQLKWNGDSAFDLGLIFVDNNQKLRTVHQIVDPNSMSSTQVYDASGSQSNGFLNYNPLTNTNEISINLAQLNTAKVPGNSKLQKIRIKAVTREVGTSITIRPITNASSLPNQVRRIEAFSYSTESLDTAAPVITTQLPLEPMLPGPLMFAQNLHSLRSPVCGDNIVDGKEECDDTNIDACLANCTLPILGMCEINTIQNATNDDYPYQGSQGKKIYSNGQFSNTPIPGEREVGYVSAQRIAVFNVPQYKQNKAVNIKFDPEWIHDHLLIMVQDRNNNWRTVMNGCWSPQNLAWGSEGQLSNPITLITRRYIDSRVGYGGQGYCDVDVACTESVPLTVTPNDKAIAIKVTEGRLVCNTGTNNTSWHLRFSCNDTKYRSCYDIGWTGNCGPGGHDGN